MVLDVCLRDKDSAPHELSLTTFLYKQKIANNNISLRFRINDDGSGDFTLNNIDSTANVATLIVALRGHVTFNNFNLYRGNIAKEVKEHMNPSSFINEYFSVTPDLNNIYVYIVEA